MNLLFTENKEIYQTSGLFVYNVLNAYSNKIAAFDLDNTIITTLSNKIFAKTKMIGNLNIKMFNKHY